MNYCPRLLLSMIAAVSQLETKDNNHRLVAESRIEGFLIRQTT